MKAVIAWATEGGAIILFSFRDYPEKEELEFDQGARCGTSEIDSQPHNVLPFHPTNGLDGERVLAHEQYHR